jgi:thiol-disulfide isomerase/thioredoxin
MAQESIVTSLSNFQSVRDLFNVSVQMVILKLGADWCGPCKAIEPTVKEWFAKMPSHIQCCNIDIDTNIELYGYFRNKKIVKGIPALLCYMVDNDDGYPDDFYSGGDITHVNMFFERCASK